MSKKKKKRTANNMSETTKPNPEVEPELKDEEVVSPEEQAAEQVITDAETESAGEGAEQAEEIILTSEQAKALKAELDKLREERDDAIRQAQRLQAEFENYRKRNASLAADSRDDGVRDTVKQLLPVLDNFDRAMENAPEDDAFAQGVKIIAKQLMEGLAKCGVEEVEADGMFDPNLHEAVMKDSTEGVEPGMITAVFQKGYRVKGKIIRHTMVKVNE